MNLSIFPKTKNSFEGQLPDEKTVTVVRMHWFVLIGCHYQLVFNIFRILADRKSVVRRLHDYDEPLYILLH